MVEIAASVLSADFGNLARDIKLAEEGGADIIHFDMMDGHFVPNLTIGPMIVQALRDVTKLPFDVHLMVDQPDNYINWLANIGCQSATVHVEACSHLNRTIAHILSKGMKAGVSLNPATPLSFLDYILPYLYQVLIMTVEPGFGGQDFIEEMYAKIQWTKSLIKAKNAKAKIEVDGGINEDTTRDVVAVGADILVAGSTIFNYGAPYDKNDEELRGRNIKGAIEILKREAEEGLKSCQEAKV